LGLPGIASERSNSVTVGLEGYLDGVAGQLDHVSSTSTTSRYFSDVNGDGIADLVDGPNVLFGRIGSGEVPVYGVANDSSATPVPVAAGHLETSGLFGDFAADRGRLGSSLPPLDTVRRWVAPFAGIVSIGGSVKLAAATASQRAASPTADGVRVAIQKDSTELGSADIAAGDSTAHLLLSPEQDLVSVAKGDRLYFRVGSKSDGGLDQVDWDPQIEYECCLPGATDVNGLGTLQFGASNEFTLGGRVSEMTAPLTGTLHLSGDVKKAHATPDDITVVILRDGAQVFNQTIQSASAGSTPVNLDVAVQKGQKLKWQLRTDSEIDFGSVSWTPKASYTAAEGVDRVVDGNGDPLINVFPPYETNLYPLDTLTAPQLPFVVPSTGGAQTTVTVTPSFVFAFGAARPSGQVVFTAKRRGQLIAKQFLTVTNGVVTTTLSQFTMTQVPGTEVFFDFNAKDPVLQNFVSAKSVSVTVAGGASQTVPSVLHSAGTEGAFPQAYRGWGVVGYTAGGSLGTQPIAEANLVMDDNFKDQLPQSVDPQGQKDGFGADPKVVAPKVVPFVADPKDNRWGVGDDSWVGPLGASSARLGGGSVDLPRPGDFAGGRGVPRVARSSQLSLTGGADVGVGTVGGSVASGDSTGQLDFLDLNGDGFPDVVGALRVQYSDPDGGLGQTFGVVPDGAVRSSGNISGNAKAGAPGRTIVTGQGKASPSGPGRRTRRNRVMACCRWGSVRVSAGTCRVGSSI
jgi:hypothetical protein